MSHEKFKFVLQQSRMITPRVLQMSLRRADGQAFTYIPGQFITLHLPFEATELRRSYSVATIPGSGGDVEIAVTQVEGGRATGLLFAMQPGDEVNATGPFGRFVLREDPPSRYLLIATGTGVSPYRAMLPQLKALIAEKQHTAVVMLGVRGPDECLFGGDFIEFAKENPGFEFVAGYSRRVSDPAQPHERKGYVQEHLMELSPDPKKDIVYLCGNPDMIDTAVERLKAIGFDNTNLRREKYVSSN
ncbi:MAG TPA: FAD-binding oxidoreductase [Gammaproteobacteria bacterium]|jgi:ferredoxin-NADP reductase